MPAKLFTNQIEDLDYLIQKLTKSEQTLIKDKVLIELVAIKLALNHNQESLTQEQFHQLSINSQSLRKEAKNTPIYREIKNKHQPRGLQIEKSKEASICLLSQKEISTPLAAPCGHLFNQDALVFFYQTTKRKKNLFVCPYIGCNRDWTADKFIPKSD
ncbi:hypothetical protein NEHOM01_2108 [Nematocida homosporus]|uniref:uncharacterized protein n=1 Tax=Nematocida homosporus TaxID=1912981 RepID=UPI0022206406|nr:uncharacterized protein NEHOM01_2108 [Nematocida homosporus]KAI5187346.1 hypothetical protein NEHOM01_2108 [Nematocida homosporus]